MPGATLPVEAAIAGLGNTIRETTREVVEFGKKGAKSEKEVADEVRRHTEAIADYIIKKKEAGRAATEFRQAAKREFDKTKEQAQEKLSGILSDKDIKRLEEYNKRVKDFGKVGAKERYDPEGYERILDLQNKLKEAKKTYKREVVGAETLYQGKMKESLNLDKDAIIKKEEYNRAIRDSRKSIRDLTKEQKVINDETYTFGQRLDIAISKILTYRIAYGIYRELTQGIADATRQAIEFQSTIQDLKKVLDADTTTFQKLSDEAFRIGKIFGKSGNEVANTFAVFAQQGLNTNQILEETQASMLLAATSGISLEEAINDLTAVVQVYPEFMNAASIAVDKWAKVQAIAPVTTQDLANAMKQVGPAAAEVGLSLDEFNGIVTAINYTTRKSGKEIGNSLKTMFSQFASPEIIKKLQMLGIAVMQTQDEFRPLGDVLIDLNEKWQTWDNARRVSVAQMIGQKRRYTDFMALMQGFGNFIDATSASMIAQGEASRMAQFELEKFNRVIGTIKNSISQTGQEIAKQATIPLEIWGLTFLAKRLNVVNQSIDRFKALGIAVGITGSAFVALRIAIWAYTKAMTGGTGATITFAAAMDQLRNKATTAAGAAALFSKALGIFGILATAATLVTYVLSMNKAKKANEELQKSIEGSTESLDDFLKKEQDVFNSTVIGLDKIEKLKPIVERGAELKKQIDYYIDYKKVLEDTNKEIGIINEKEKKYREELEKIKHPTAIIKPGGRSLIPTVPTINQEKLNKIQLKYNSIIEEKNKLEIKHIQLEKISNMTIDERKKAQQELIKEFEKLKAEEQDILYKKTPSFTGIELAKATENVYELIARLDNLQNKLGKSASIADNFGNSFNYVEEKSKEIERIQGELNSISLEYEETNNKLLQIQNKMKLLRGEERDSYEKQINILKTNKDLLKKAKDDAQAKIDAHKKDIQAYKEQKKLIIETEADIARTNELYDFRIKLLNVEKQGVQKLSSMKAIDFTTLQKILKEELKIIDLQEQKEINEENTNYNLKKQINTIQDSNFELQHSINLQKIYGKYAKERALTQIQELNNIQKTIRNIQDELSTAFSQSFAEIPKNIVENNRARKEIEIDRKAAEKELAKAIKSNDQSAIIDAKNRIIELENSIKKLKPVWLGVFESIGDIGLEHWGKTLAQSILTDRSAEFLASGIIPASLKGAEAMKQKIIEGFSIGTGKPIPSNTAGTTGIGINYTRKIPTTPTNIGVKYTGKEAKGGIGLQYNPNLYGKQIIDSGSLVADKFQRAIEAGGNLAAVVLIRAMGIGTSETSNALSNVGALFGAAAGEQWLGSLKKFAGPVGTLVGSLLGAGIGSLFEKDLKEPLDQNSYATRQNTTAIENNNSLLELQREFINAPSNYIAPPLYGNIGTGGGNMTVNINVNGSANPSLVANEVVKIIDNEYSKSARRTQNSFMRFGR